MGIDYVYRKKPVRLAMAVYDFLGSIFAKRRAPKPAQPPKHVCFVILHQIGDVVMSLSAIDGIMRALPKAQFSALLGKVPAPLFAATMGDKVRVTEFDAAWQYAVTSQTSTEEAAQEFVRLIESVGPDVVVVFHPDLKINQLLRKTSVQYTIGFSNAGGGFHLTHPVEMPRTGHQVERNHVLAQVFCRVFGLNLPKFREPSVGPDPTSHLYVWEGYVTGNPYAVIHPFGRFNSRNWSLDGWRKVIDHLLSMKLQPMIIGGASDDGSAFEGVDDLTGELDLPQTCALIQSANVFIGIDSGPGHIAAAVDTPVVSIFSSANVPDRWAPYGENVRVLYSPDIDRAKWPLEARDLPLGTQGNPYTDKITAEAVIEAIEEMRRR